METAEVSFVQKKVLCLRLRTWLLLLLLTPILIWILLNLLFSTSFGTGILERKIEGKIALSCQIEKVTWSPWAGVSVKNLEVYTPENVVKSSRILHVLSVSVDPSWTSLMKGGKRFEKVEINGLRGEISIEEIRELMTRYHRVQPEVAVEPPRKQELPVVQPKPPIEKPKLDPIQSPEPKTSPKRDEKREVVSESVPVDDFEGTVIMKNVNFRLYSQKQPEIEMSLQDLEAEIPIWGGERDGELRVGALAIGDYLADLDQVFPIKWDGESIHFQKSKVKLFGMDLEIVAQVRAVVGLPMGLQVNLPKQKMDLSPIYPDERAPIEVTQLTSQAVLRGYLLNPNSFSGQSITTFTDLVLHDPKDGGETRFNRGSAILKFGSAGLVASDVRAIGDDDSVLSNGYVTTSGDAAAMVRIVSSPERAESHEKRIRNTSPLLSLEFSPLVTPDREYKDIRIESRSGILAMDLGANEQWVPFFSTVRAILGSPPPLKTQLP